MKKFRYKAVDLEVPVTRESILKTCNEQGLLGWRLVAVSGGGLYGIFEQEIVYKSPPRY